MLFGLYRIGFLPLEFLLVGATYDISAAVGILRCGGFSSPACRDRRKSRRAGLGSIHEIKHDGFRIPASDLKPAMAPKGTRHVTEDRQFKIKGE